MNKDRGTIPVRIYSFNGLPPTERMKRLWVTALVLPCGQHPARLTLAGKLSFTVPDRVAFWLTRPSHNLRLLNIMLCMALRTLIGFGGVGTIWMESLHRRTPGAWFVVGAALILIAVIPWRYRK